MQRWGLPMNVSPCGKALPPAAQRKYMTRSNGSLLWKGYEGYSRQSHPGYGEYLVTLGNLLIALVFDETSL